MNYSEIGQADAAHPAAFFRATGDGNSKQTEVNQDASASSASVDTSLGIDQYYHELGLPLTATQEEIKSHYKQLVRLHHPDRFIDLTQKLLAEERFKVINEAYRILSSRAVEGQLVKFMQRELGLIVEPSMVDFGILERRQQRTATFHVRFEKDVEGVDFVPSEEDSWFHVAKVSHLYGSDHASLEFEVAVDATGLAAQTYQGWIDIYLDSTMARVPLTMQVVRLNWHAYQIPRHWMLLGIFVLAVALFTTAFAFTNARSFTYSPEGNIVSAVGTRLTANGPVIDSPAAITATSTHHLYFSLLEQGQLAIYTTLLNGSAIPRRIVAGTQATGLQNRRLVAYLDQQSAQTQLFLYNQSTGRTVQLTTDNLPKSQLAWSNDGIHVAYLVGTGTTARIGVYDTEQHREDRLPGAITAGVSNFAWSPDGNTLLFDLWRDRERRVYRMTVPDGELHQLTHFDSWAGTWSADGNEVIVASATGLYRLDQSGRQLRQITNEAAEQPQWSADGAWVAYLVQSLDSTDQDQRLWIMQPDGSAAQPVAADVLWHAWSPDGATLGYVTGNRQSTDALFYLWISQTDGQSRLVAEVNNPYFSWGR